MTPFKSGFVSLIGRPNVGKSTLMNCLMKEKISIISNKAQTTRNKIKSILTKDDFQIIFIDTPGIHKPKSKLGNFMVKSVESTFNDVDIILFLIDSRFDIKNEDKIILERLKNIKSYVFLIINKIDKIGKENLLKIIDEYRVLYNFKEIVPISAIKNDNIDILLETIKKYLNEGPKYFPDDMITDQHEYKIISEMIREKILYLLQEEVPHGVVVEIESIVDRSDRKPINIEAIIYIEKNSHKHIIIGKEGKVLKEIGIRSRKDIEKFLGCKVYLRLWIKIKKDWKDNNFLLKTFGYDSKNL